MLQGLINWVAKFSDLNANAFVTEDSTHKKIHEGNGFNVYANFASVANGAVKNIVFHTPDDGRYPHMKFREFWTSGSKVDVGLYEAPTNAPTGGTDLTVINRNRNSPKVTSMQVMKHTATIDTTGATLIDSITFGANASYRPLELEFVLKPDSWYIVQITNNSGSAADINAFLFWYEL
jgi:hypothetical protein